MVTGVTGVTHFPTALRTGKKHILNNRFFVFSQLHLQWENPSHASHASQITPEIKLSRCEQ